MSRDQDHRHMARAIQLAARARYTTQPNPQVGCVLVRDGQVVGEGYHRRAGEPHAERNALAEAGDLARGSTAYVTLEPCCHQGRTPPCTEGLIEAGVSRVVAAMRDPNPKVAGQGFDRLRSAGIEVLEGIMQAQAEALNSGFVKRMSRGLPYVRCKLAMSLDGRTAMASGESQWITSAQARSDVQRLRAISGAILTGVGTLLSDDPSLTVRLDHESLEIDPDLPLPRPVRVVLDPVLDTPVESRMLALPGLTLIICQDENPAHGAALEGAGAQVVMLPGEPGRLDLWEVMRYLASQEINDVLVESGATLAGALLEQGLIDELIVYQAPHIMGDAARGLFHLPEIQRMQQRISLNITDVRQVGPDIRFTAIPGTRA
ncbi:MAG: bifunctional diaminohydroxyphosphoribosylaminopyrimidine deaminase/5-amino-6-(5-phosphoribosylamino)uracil reductase RibD [Candidatus Thiodiazotropha sp.]